MLVGGMERGRRGRGIGARRLAEEGLREKIRILAACLEAVEVGRCRDPELGDASEEEVEEAAGGLEGESAEVRLLRSVLIESSKPKPELPTYDGNLSIEVLLDWISEMDKYFKCEEVSEDRRVKFATRKLKGHGALWWDSVQNERKRLNKAPIKTWSRMVAMLKGIFLSRDYQIALHRQVKNMRHKGLTLKEYMEEFYRVNLRAGYTEDTAERTARYANGLRLDILDEISILSPNNTEEVYQSAMKAEEKITRRQNARRGQGASRGKGQSCGRGQTTNNNEEASSSKASRSANRGDSARGNRSSQRGRGNGRGRGVGYQCYRCHKWGHRSFDCPEVDPAGQRGAYVAQPEEAAAPPQEAEKALETGEALVLHKVLLKPVNGSTDNLVSTKMVEKLELKRSKHPNPYRVSWLQKGHQLLVDERSEVEFQIGRYKDKVVCDIIPMDVCHILLGRPWQYDRKVVHDGLTRCCKFVNDGIEHTLVPIKEEGTTETSEPRTLLVSRK
eukprot:PITA_34746